jgi:hypothetical protein
MDKNKGQTDDDGNVFYDYVCEGCESEGSLRTDAEQNLSFNCPVDCGARYIQQYTSERGWELWCVVKPVFEGK